MRVVVDCRYIRLGPPDGISRYTIGLVTALARRHPLTVLVSDLRQLSRLPELPHLLVSDPTSLREPWVARQVNRLDPDVVFTPMQTMGSWGRRYRLVLTVHDLIYYRHPRPPARFGWPLRLLWRLYHLSWWPQRLLLDRADAVVTVSETTRALIETHRLTRRPVTVVPNAADPSPTRPPCRARLAAEDAATMDPGVQGAAAGSHGSRSLVYTGTFMAYKNVGVLARALHELPGFTLHLISPITDVERRGLEGLAPPGSLTCHDGASDEDYHETLRSALALVTASHDEGFGIPLVEAMAAGIPVVVSDIPVFREVGGSAALFCEPDDPVAFAGAVRQLTDPAEWLRRSVLCREQGRRFSWDTCADRLLTLLDQVVGAAAPAPPPSFSG